MYGTADGRHYFIAKVSQLSETRLQSSSLNVSFSHQNIFIDECRHMGRSPITTILFTRFICQPVHNENAHLTNYVLPAFEHVGDRCITKGRRGSTLFRSATGSFTAVKGRGMRRTALEAAGENERETI